MAVLHDRTRSKNINGRQQHDRRPRRHGYRTGHYFSTSSSGNGSYWRNQNHYQTVKKSQYVALDCEMVGTLSGESVVARVVLVNGSGNVIFDAYIKPEETITDYRTFISGITETDLERNGKPFSVVRSEVLALFKGKILVGHALSNDLHYLRIDHPWFMQRDTAYYKPFMQIRQRQDGTAIMLPRKLRELASEHLGRSIQVPGRPHSPAEDAIAALDLYMIYMPFWEQYVADAVLYHSPAEDAIAAVDLYLTRMPFWEQYMTKAAHYQKQQSMEYQRRYHGRERVPHYSHNFYPQYSG